MSTPGIVAGAPTVDVPLPRLPAATTITTSLSKAYWNALSQLVSQSVVLVVKERLMMSAPLSTAQRMPSATWSTNGTAAEDPKPTEIESRSASGATPIIPVSAPVPRAAAREATQLPWLASTAPTGVRPSVDPRPDMSVPPTTAGSSSTGPRAMPVSITAIVTPAPRVVSHASVMP